VQDQEQHTQKGVRILVADDNHIGRRALEKILSKRGHEIALAKDGLQAVQTYSEFRPSVVLMDIEMPHVDGLEATRRIRAYEAQHNLPRSKIFAVSGYAREETQREALAAGMDGYLPKPFKPHELEAVLQTRE
jgi:CheY-like chemotaxis protein